MFAPPSPCNGICKIDQTTGYCIGCLRTLEEVVDWPMLSSREKREVIELIGKRTAQAA